ncbi:hydantoinase/oxoprolinase family protein [Roseomonas sp. CECT 9278]|uniref:hydantoinase/oxoprolinase family protein n=1 Tax=Roseomonas sp. CECT 9278 TaxID=2845823 RepID=UPI001E62E990|nr:hydantoinase/oxoprolinase family protein [Roseomonas sp. CECT 9278]CAH0293368.1 Acetophenone carboxylase gamma subunit [Roseomonas sp. CECT 9278]
MRRIAGIDVGGTFTDLVMQEADGSIRIAKVPTTAANQAGGVLAAIAAAGTTPAALDLIVHGTTATTNAVLERKLAKVGLITTAGFRDVLELGRRTRPRAYGMTGSFEPLVPRELRREVAERMDARGAVVTPLDEAAVEREVSALLAEGCEALVIHFLHAYANPAHERRAGEIARAIWPNGYVTLGHALLSEFREYERGTTASVNAAVQPVLDRYIRHLQDRLAEAGHARDLLVMNGNGGTVPARAVAAEAAKTVMSGPASGVMAAAATLAQSGVRNAITCDMGGTSTDVALIAGGVPEVSAELSIAYGLPIHLPMVDVRTVGAGGGSIAWIDRGGMLRVGPESAGSAPGPICYGRGGTRPTVTDANLLLGRLDSDALLTTGRRISVEEVRAAFASLGEPLAMTAEAAAAAVIRLANVLMAGAIRMVSLSRGHDPRDFALFAFGGAGPLHAVALAREIGIPEVFVPFRPGLTNALGCLVADLRQDVVNTLNRGLDDIDAAEIAAVLAAQIDRATAAVRSGGAEVERIETHHLAEMQFRGQTHLIRVPLASAKPSRAEVQAAFEAAYFARFEVRLPEIRAVLVNLCTSVVGRRPAFDLRALAGGSGAPRIGERRLHADGAWHDAAVWRREALAEGARIEGPAVLQQADATTILEPGSAAVVDALGNLRITV